MFTWLRSLESATAIVELHSDRIRVRDVSGDVTFEFEPLLSIDASQQVLSIGQPLHADAVKTYAPFASRAALLQDWRIAQLILQYAYSKLGSIAWPKPAPRIVLCVNGELAEEARRLDDETLVKLSAAAGARVTVVHRGRPLSDVEAQRLLDSA